MTPLALLLCALLPPLPAAPSPSVDELLERVESLEKQRADIEKQKQEALDALKARLKEIQERLDRLHVPTPKPPDPKPPEPPPPADPLAAKLKAAFDADAAALAVKREQAKDLAALYRAAAKLAGDPATATSGELLQRVRDAAGNLVGADALREVRRVVGRELGALLPTDEPLTESQRKSAAALFARLAALLDALGG